MYISCNPYICSTIYPTDNDMYILELNTQLKTYSCNDGTIITLDSTELSVNPSSPITIEEIKLSGSNCSGAIVVLTPNKKTAQIIYPNFFSASSNNQLDESNCKMSITLNINDEDSCSPLMLNYLLQGQAIVQDNSEARVIVECKTLEKFNFEYSNNYSTEVDIRLNKFCC